MKITKKKIFLILGMIFLLNFVFAFLFFFVGSAPKVENVAWGVNFSQKHMANFGLDWKKAYTAILDDLKAKRLKVAAHWDLLEPEKDAFRFDDVDWQIAEAEKRNAEILLAIGMKTPRWPECHIPSWASSLSKEGQQEEVLNMLSAVVSRYKDSPAIWGWQVENEPFFVFGECPWADADFLKREVELVKSLDPNHSVVVSDSGEGSFWVRAALYGDIVGTTMYRKVWFHEIGMYVNYPLPPTFYWRKAWLIQKLFGKEVIGVELQAEPWGPKLLYDLPLEEQKKTMDREQFLKNIDFARKTGFKEHYLWGTEWWYVMKEKHNDPTFWEEAKKLFDP